MYRTQPLPAHADSNYDNVVNVQVLSAQFDQSQIVATPEGPGAAK